MLYDRQPIHKWRIDDNGFMRVTARVLSAGVMQYLREELPDDFPPGEVFDINVPFEEMTDPETMHSLEGAAVVAGDHDWISVDSRSELEVGSVAGSASIDGPYLMADFIIRDGEAIEKIKSNALGDISSAYISEVIPEPGNQQSCPFHGVQRKIRFNHVSILPPGEGRGGREVRILNAGKPKGAKMDDFKSVEVGGRAIRVHNADADILKTEIENKEAVTNQSADKMTAMMAELEEAKRMLDEANTRYEQAMGQMSEMKAKMDELMDPAYMQNQVDEMAMEQGEATDMMKNAGMYDEKTMNSIKKLRGHALRVHVINSMRKADNRPELTENEAKAEGFVTGIYNTLLDFDKAGKTQNQNRRPNVVGSDVINKAREKIQNRGANRKDPLGYGKFNKMKGGD